MKNFELQILDNTRESLKYKGWMYSPAYSTKDEVYYTYHFAVYKNLLYCDFILNQETKRVNVMVSNADGSTYAPFYNDKYSTNNLVVLEIENNIDKKLKKLGVKTLNENSNRG